MGTRLEPAPKQRPGVPSCADAPASPSPKRGRSTPSAPVRRARGRRSPAPSAAPRAAAPRPTSRPFPYRLSGPWRRWWGRSTALVMLVAMGGGALLSRLREEGGSGGVCEEGVAATSKGERTASVSSAYKEGRGGRFGLPNKRPPTISPTMPHSTHAVMGERG